jgi:hypothetical protein
MSLWSTLAAPLLPGNDPSRMGNVTKRILMNQDVIAVIKTSWVYRLVVLGLFKFGLNR